jgi:hypothetical protein
MSLVMLFVLHKSDLDVQQTGLLGVFLNKSLCLIAALGVTKFIAINADPGHVLLCDLSLT